MRLSDFKALTFDCYGTLIDWESGMIAALEPLISRMRHRPDRDEILAAHARHESAQQEWTPTMPYCDLLGIVYKRLAEEWGVSHTRRECIAYGRSVGDWPAFADSINALAYLEKHFKLVILSNVDNAGFARSHERLQVRFDAIYTAQDIGSYKPADRNFLYMLDKLKAQGIEKQEILHTAESLFHDHVPARRHGLACCWIYRRHDQKGFGATMAPKELPAVDFRFNSMADLAQAHRKALST